MLLTFSSIIFLNILSPIHAQGDQSKAIENLRNNLNNVWNDNWNNWTVEARTDNKWDKLFGYERNWPKKETRWEWDKFGEATIRFALESDTMMQKIHDTLSRSLSVVKVLDTNQQEMSTEMGNIQKISQNTSSIVGDIKQTVDTLVLKVTNMEWTSDKMMETICSQHLCNSSMANRCSNVTNGNYSNQIDQIMESKYRKIVIILCSSIFVLLMVMMIGFLVLLSRINVLSNLEKINQVKVDCVTNSGNRIIANTDSEEPNHVPLNHTDDNVYTYITNQ